MHICISKLNIIGSDNGLAHSWPQAIIWTSAGILLIWPLGTNFSEILLKIHTFLFKKMNLKMSSGKWWPFCLSLDEFSELHRIFELQGHMPPRVTIFATESYLLVLIQIEYCTVTSYQSCDSVMSHNRSRHPPPQCSGLHLSHLILETTGPVAVEKKQYQCQCFKLTVNKLPILLLMRYYHTLQTEKLTKCGQSA